MHESGSGTFRTWRDVCYESVMRGIMLQNSQNAEPLIFRKKTKQAIIADQLSDGGFRITEWSGLGELHGLCARR